MIPVDERRLAPPAAVEDVDPDDVTPPLPPPLLLSRGTEIPAHLPQNAQTPECSLKPTKVTT